MVPKCWPGNGVSMNVGVRSFSHHTGTPFVSKTAE